jgi:sortase A
LRRTGGGAGVVVPVDPGRRGRDRGSAGGAIRIVGELAIAFGVIVALFVAYEVYVTGWLTESDQREVTEQLHQDWSGAPRAPAARVAPGEPLAVLRIPALGSDWRFTVVEGTDARALARGPGHYIGTAYPGEPGNAAIAAHRISRAAPFGRLDELKSCDAIVVEMRDTWYVYRVLPMAGERDTWPQHAQRPECGGVYPMPGGYAATVGREIVAPTERSVLADVPHRPDLRLPAEALVPLLTLTTCHPRFSAEQRLIVHAVLVAEHPKDPAGSDRLPPELAEP